MRATTPPAAGQQAVRPRPSVPAAATGVGDAVLLVGTRVALWLGVQLGLAGLLVLAGCQKGAKQAKATEKEEGWNPRGAYQPPPNATEPKRGGIRGDSDMVGAAGQNVRQGAERQKAKGILENLGLFYQQYNTENGRWPANQQEFISYIQRDAPHVVEALKNGYFVVFWNTQPDSNTILAYEKASYARARTVLIGTKSVVVMPDEEFNQRMKGKR